MIRRIDGPAARSSRSGLLARTELREQRRSRHRAVAVARQPRELNYDSGSPRKSVTGSSCTIEQASSRLILVRTIVTAFAIRSNVSVWRMHSSCELGSATTV
jgi:hypothetical protein